MICIVFDVEEVSMSAIKVTIHSSGSGVCSLTGKESDGLTITFEDGTVRDSFLSWRAFRQLLGMKTSQGLKPEAEPRVQAPLVPAAVGQGLGNGK
jgi:hypothetical protein